MGSFHDSGVLLIGSRADLRAAPMTARRPSAFSIVEMLVSIGIVAVFIGLALPPLGRVREASLALRSESNLKQIGFALGSYLGSYNDVFPFGQEGQVYSTRMDPAGMRESFEHFEFDRAWPVLVRDVAEWEEFGGAMVSPGWRKRSVLPCDYIYSHAFLARPELWSGTATIADVAMLRPVMATDATFPASKVIVWDGAAKFLRRPKLLSPGIIANPIPMLFVDSHVSQNRVEDAADSVLNPLNPNPSTRIMQLHNTPLGARGRDY